MSYIHRNVSKVIKFYRSGVAAPSNVGVWVKVGLYTLNVRLRIKFYRRNICQQFNPKGGGGDIFTYGWGYVIPMVYMSMWLRIFDSGGWGVVCCRWGFLTLGVGFCMLCPINQSAVSYDSHWTTSRLDNGTRRYRPIHGLSVNQAY